MQPTGRNLNQVVTWAPPSTVLCWPQTCSWIQQDLQSSLHWNTFQKCSGDCACTSGWSLLPHGLSHKVLNGPAEVPLLKEAAVNKKLRAWVLVTGLSAVLTLGQ